MSTREGQLLVKDGVGAVIGHASAIQAPGATIENGLLLLPGTSGGGGLAATSYKGASAPSGVEFDYLAGVTDPIQGQIDALISPVAPFTIFKDDDDDDRPLFKVYEDDGPGGTPSFSLFNADEFELLVEAGDGYFQFINTNLRIIPNSGSWPLLIDGTVSYDLPQLLVRADGVDVFRVEKEGSLYVKNFGSIGTTAPTGTTAGVLNLGTGLRIANAATSGDVLRGNGTNFVSAALAAADLSDFNTAADARITLQKGAANGLASLGADSKIPTSQLPALAITNTFVVASQVAMLALTAETGDVAVRSDLNKSFILAGANPATLAHWQELLTPTDTVLSVNGQTGVVVLTTSHITEGTNLYYTQARFDTAFAAKSTTNLPEGTNLYYTDERVDDRVSALILGTTNQVTSTYNDGAGTLTLALPQNIHSGASPTFTGLTLSGNLTTAGVASSLIPSVTDTYDLGSSTKLWRKGWLSELDAVLFAQNTVSVIGGWLLVTKNEGTIPVGQDVGTGDTTIDFGQAMTTNDFVLFRAAGSVEYIQVLTLSAGTRYNVTRNLDGTGANAWPSGSVYAVLGNSTNGRIEINANSTPRISLIKQGATYNAQTELLRVGDLNGGWTYGAETYGFAAGEYASGKAWVSVDPTNGFRIGLHSVINGQWDTGGNLALGQVATNSGNAFWNNSNKRFEFRGGAGGTVVSSYIDTSGRFVMADAEVSGALNVTGSISSGSGLVLLDQNGVTLRGYSGSGVIRSFGMTDGTNVVYQMWATHAPGVDTQGFLETTLNATGTNNSITVLCRAPSASKSATTALQADSTTYGTAQLSVLATSSGAYAFTNVPLSVGDGAFPSGGAKLHVEGVANILTGLRINGSATSTHYLRGNGTNIVLAALSASDLSTGTIPNARFPLVVTLGTGLTSNSPQIKFDYGPSGGGDFTGMMGAVDMLSFGFNSAGTYGGTGGTSAARTIYFYDRVAGAFRGGLNASGEFYIGTTNTAYGLKVAQATSGTSLTIHADGGVTAGAPTGGSKGAGAFNLAGDIYKNNVAYTSPDYVLEHWATGRIVKYADKEGASDYVGLKPLREVREFARRNLHLPRFGQDAGHGLFSGGESLLASLEEAYLYIFELEDRIGKLEAH